MSTTKAEKYGFKISVDIVSGLKKTIDWFLNYDHSKTNRYNSFKEKI